MRSKPSTKKPSNSDAVMEALLRPSQKEVIARGVKRALDALVEAMNAAREANLITSFNIGQENVNGRIVSKITHFTISEEIKL